MNFTMGNFLMALFSFLCAFATIYMSIYWSYQFSLNKDLCLVDYRQFYEGKDDVFPTISLCLMNPFLNENLAEYGVNQSIYLDFLKGNYASTDMLSIAYENVTIELSHFIRGYFVRWRNQTSVTVDLKLNPSTKILTSTSFNGFWGEDFYKCFSPVIPPDKNIRKFSLLVSNEVFPNGLRPTRYGLRTFVHLPKALLISLPTEQFLWPKRSSNENYVMNFEVEEVEILRKRNKGGTTCYENWREYDDWIVKLHRNTVMCNNPYQTKNDDLPLCTRKDQMLRSRYYLDAVTRNEHILPCKTMEGVRVKSYDHSLVGTQWEGNGEFWLDLEFKQEKFKEIRQTR